jgi:hypothetical protein
MLTGRDSRSVERWLRRDLGATFKRRARHGAAYARTCPRCGRDLRVVVPGNREHLSEDTLDSICRQAHVNLRGEPDCPFRR